MLARLGWTNITVYDRLPEPPPPDSPFWAAGSGAADDAGRAAAAAGGDGRSYNIGLGGRGQLALSELDCLERVAAVCAEVTAVVRWEPGFTAFATVARGSQPLLERKKAWTSRIIRRDRLAACLLAEARARHPAAVTTIFGADCAEVRLGTAATDPVTLTLRHAAAGAAPEREERVTAALVVGTDGVNSAVKFNLHLTLPLPPPTTLAPLPPLHGYTRIARALARECTHARTRSHRYTSAHARGHAHIRMYTNTHAHAHSHMHTHIGVSSLDLF